MAIVNRRDVILQYRYPLSFRLTKYKAVANRFWRHKIKPGSTHTIKSDETKEEHINS